MKRFIYIIPAILLLGMLVSCSNDDVTITDTSTCLVNVTVNLTDFFSCYDFTDTKHSVDNAANSSEFGSNKRFNSLNPAERYKSFNEYYFSNPSLSIETNVLVYNDKGLLVEAKKDRTGNTEPIDLPFHFQLDVGKYTVIATLTFFRTTSDAYWTLKEEENLSTVYLQSKDESGNLWSIMSYTYEEIKVGESKEKDLQLTPKPVGALCYAFFENFQSSDIDDISVETDNFANGFKLNPNEPNKFIYSEKKVLFEKKPNDFIHVPSWTTFQSDFFDYFYILAPKCNISFVQRSGNSEESIGLPSPYSIENGKTYLAYWDYNHLDKPYFGLADNNHWY